MRSSTANEALKPLLLVSMERNEEVVDGITSHPVAATVTMDGDEETMVGSNFFLDHVGEVSLTLDSQKLSWDLVDSNSADKELNASYCFGVKLASKLETEIKISDIYAVELIYWGLIHESVLPDTGGCLLGRDSEMYRFTVHGYQRSKKQCSLYLLISYTFGHRDLQTCQAWVDHITAFIHMNVGRPKRLLVFVHPRSGKGNGCRTWENVAPIFSRAKVKTKVTVTERAGHAFDVMASIKDKELNSYDGVIAVGGDGFFNEILNGLLLSRHRAPFPPAPAEFMHSVGNVGSISVSGSEGTTLQSSDSNEDQDSLLPCSEPSAPGFSNVNQSPSFPLQNKQFRLGIIPSGSTDAIVICTTGARDPVTSALHIVLGRRICLDIAQVVRWKKTNLSKAAPFVRYAASFAGYGFYGDVIKESEKYRWMGPMRYDCAGTKVFLKHRSYPAEIAYINAKAETENSTSNGRTCPQKRPTKVICRVNCSVCNDSIKSPQTSRNPNGIDHTNLKESRWSRSRGRFLSVGAAVISCRNEKAPDGLVADAHLSDGFLHLILIKDCPHAFYLWHLTQLAKKGGDPLNFEFVEHHKTPAFTFTSSGEESVWNLDGELFEAHQLSAQVFRGLVSLFASGPEV